jgi:hypothetical protein
MKNITEVKKCKSEKQLHRSEKLCKTEKQLHRSEKCKTEKQLHTSKKCKSENSSKGEKNYVKLKNNSTEVKNRKIEEQLHGSEKM